jgi:putative SOS response-associated peptidase YedK
MCNRFTLSTDKDDLQSRYGFIDPDGVLLKPRYNIAPTQYSSTAVVNRDIRELKMMRWGLVSFWARDIKIGNKLTNAKAETLTEKRSYKRSFREKRCLILADGFYEWKEVNKRKIPFRFVLKTRKPFSFAGLWDEWKTPEGDKLLSFTMITTSPNSLIEPIHGRMPVILHPQDESKWLDPELKDTDKLSELLVPFPSDLMEAYEVSTIVNYYKKDSPDCIRPVAHSMP